MKDNKNPFGFAQVQSTESNDSIFEYSSTSKEAWNKFRKNRLAIVGTIIFIALIVLAIIFSLLPNFDPTTQNDSIADQSAWTSDHWWGTDYAGRDFWSRNWAAVKFSLLLAFVTTTLNIIIAIIIGLTMGYYDKFDKVFGYVIKIMYTLPTIIILILFSVVFDSAKIASETGIEQPTVAFFVIVLSLVFSGWTDASQQIRGAALKTKNLDFITASQTLGTKRFKILGIFFKYAMPIIIVQYAIIFPRMIISEAILGFLGLSIPDTATLGNLINDGRSTFLSYPHELFIPLAMLILTTVSIQFMGFGIEDALIQKEGR